MSTPSQQRIPPRLWKLVVYVTAGHVVAILVLSPQFYCRNESSPEALFSRGEQAMAEGKHVEAMQYFRQVMDQQPKPPAIYTRAAEQHRLADRMARQEAGKKAQEAERQSTQPPEATPQDSPSTKPATRPTTSSSTPKPDAPFIPPELRP